DRRALPRPARQTHDPFLLSCILPLGTARTTGAMVCPGGPPLFSCGLCFAHEVVERLIYGLATDRTRGLAGVGAVLLGSAFRLRLFRRVAHELLEDLRDLLGRPLLIDLVDRLDRREDLLDHRLLLVERRRLLLLLEVY